MNTRSLPWKALLLAPLASIPAAVVAELGGSDAGVASDLLWGFFFAAILAVPASYVGMAFLGLPAYLLLRKLNLLRLWICCAIGLFVPLVLFARDAPFRTTLMAAASGLAVSITAYLLLPSNTQSPATTSTPNDA